MKIRRRSRLRLVGVIAAAAFVSAGTLVAAPTLADVPSQAPAFANTANSSDPFAYRCAGGTYCLVDSQDLGTGGNYPMNKTLGYTSTDGIHWSAPTTIFNENQLPQYSGGQTAANHLWAPTVRFLDSGSGPDSTRYQSRLYVPDITDRTNQLSSKIYMASRGGSGMGTFGSPTMVTGATGSETNAYMSDPEVFSTSATPLTDTSHDYLIWANGDGSNCGDISARHMSSATTLDAYSSKATAQIVINGDEVLGDCTGGSSDPHPYEEGASMFNFTNWKVNTVSHQGLLTNDVLVFAAKPSTTPDTCKTAGEPNTANEVIAYATGASPTGPFTYQGILMCGSSTEWTNQATIEEVQTTQGDWRLVMIYHDGPSGNNNRKLHAECLVNGPTDQFPDDVMRSTDGVAPYSGTGRNFCLDNKAIVTLSYGGKVVSAEANSNLYATAVKPSYWEQFAIDTTTTPGEVYLKARNPGNLWVQSNIQSGAQLEARGAAPGSWEQWVFEPINGSLPITSPIGGIYHIKNVYSGLYVTVNSSNGQLIANGSQASAAPFVVNYKTH